MFQQVEELRGGTGELLEVSDVDLDTWAHSGRKGHLFQIATLRRGRPGPEYLSGNRRQVVGQYDLPDIVEGTDRLAKRISNQSRVVIADAAHLPSFEQPEVFNPLLESFIGSF